MKKHHLYIGLTCLLFNFLILSVYSQNITLEEIKRYNRDQSLTSEQNIECGAVIEAEFETNSEYNIYYIQMVPGDSLKVSAKTLGDFLMVRLSIRDPSGNVVSDTSSQGDQDWREPEFSKQPSLDTGLLSARGTYTISKPYTFLN